MRKINTYIVLVYGTGNKSNSAHFRLNVGAKSPEEAEEIAKEWLKERKLTATTRPPRTYYQDEKKHLAYKEVVDETYHTVTPTKIDSVSLTHKDKSSSEKQYTIERIDRNVYKVTKYVNGEVREPKTVGVCELTDKWRITTMTNMLKCSELQKDRPVVFWLYSETYQRKVPMDGYVVTVYPNLKEVCVGYMDGYKYLTDNIKYDDMLAAYDENGAQMRFENIVGPSILLVAE